MPFSSEALQGLEAAIQWNPHGANQEAAASTGSAAAVRKVRGRMAAKTFLSGGIGKHD